MSALPEKINVMRVVTYDVQDIVERLTETDETYRDVTIAEVMEQVNSWVEEDFNCGISHGDLHLCDLIFQDENGEDV